MADQLDHEKLDDEKLMEEVLEEHRRRPHPGLSAERLRVHAALHVVVEKQLQEGTPAGTAQTLRRLQAEGLDRHQAVHAIGSAISDELHEVMEDGQLYDEDRFLRRLAALSAAAWLAGQRSGQKS